MVFICMSIGAGMVTQETVSRIAVDDEQPNEPRLSALGMWTNAEGYYRATEVSHLQLAAAENASPEAPKTLTSTDDQITEVVQAPDGDKPSTAYGPEPTQSQQHENVNDAEDAHLHPRELVQDDSPSPSPNPIVPEPETNIDILPTPPKPTPIPDATAVADSENRPSGTGLPRTRIEIPALTEPPAVAPVRPVAPHYDSSRYSEIDPARLVRERALLRAEERRKRIEAWKWMGYSPLRPPVGATPFMQGDSRRPAVIVVPYVVHHRD